MLEKVIVRIENPSEFLCFYCERPIKSNDKLELHRSRCHKRTLTEFLCDEFGAQCLEESDLGQHRTTYHKMGSFDNEEEWNEMTNQVNSNYPDEDLYWYDFCGMQFGTLGGLQTHIRSVHQEMLPTSCIVHQQINI